MAKGPISDHSQTELALHMSLESRRNTPRARASTRDKMFINSARDQQPTSHGNDLTRQLTTVSYNNKSSPVIWTLKSTVLHQSEHRLP